MEAIKQKKILFFLYLINNFLSFYCNFFYIFFGLVLFLLPIFYYLYSSKMFQEIFVNSSFQKILDLLLMPLYKPSYFAKQHWLPAIIEKMTVILIYIKFNIFLVRFVKYFLIKLGNNLFLRI